MIKFKKTKSSVLTYIIFGASFAFIILGIVGLIQFRVDKIIEEGKKNLNNTLYTLKDGWVYELEDGTSLSTSLPNTLNLPLKTKKIILRNQLPNEEIADGALRFETIFTETHIYIDGELVKSYGKITNPNHFIYNSAYNYVFVPLETSHYGKEISIELSSIFTTELSRVRAPVIGNHHDFLMSDLLNNASKILIVTIISLFSFVLFIFYTIFRLLNNKHTELLVFSIFTLLIALLYNSQNTLLWEMFNYSDLFPAFNDWFFFVQDAFLPIFGYLIIIMVTRKTIEKRCFFSMCFHTGLYMIAAILQITWVVSINYFRPIFMATTFINYMMLFFTLKPWRLKSESKYYLIALFSIIGAYIIDYIKYLLGLLPLQQKFIIWLNLETPSLFFLSWAFIAYMVLLSYSLMLITKTDLRDLQSKAQRDMLTDLYNRNMMETHINQYIKESTELAGFIIMDIDNFKSINDTWGHLFGDLVLKMVAEELKANCGQHDFMARLGGDEFAVFMTKLIDEKQIKKRTDLLVKKINSIQIASSDQKVSVSAGLAIYPNEASTYEDLYNKSDQAMYSEKRKRA